MPIFITNNIKTKNIKTTITIIPTWTGTSAPYTQTFTVTGVTALNTVEVFLPPTATADDVTAFQALILQGGTQANGTFTLRAFGELNTANITANVIIRNDIY